MHCTNCGNPIVPGTQFCTKCGSKVVQAVERERTGGKKRIVLLTLGIVVLVISIGGNISLWMAYSSEFDRASRAETTTKKAVADALAANDIQSGFASKVADAALAEHDLNSEMFPMLSDCYSGLVPRESDFNRLSAKVTNVTDSWAGISDYVNSIAGTDSSTTIN